MDDLVEAHLSGSPQRLAELAEQGRPATAPNIAVEIVQGRGTLLRLVELLGPYLSSDEVSKRAAGTGLLSRVLSEFTAYELPAPAVALLTNFYVDRLSDVTCALETLDGVRALVRHQKLSEDQLISICAALFQVSVQSLPQLARNIAYQIIIDLLAKHRDVMLQEGDSFVLGYIQLMEGEKDPRNLRLAFSIVKELLASFPYEAHAQDLFEITSCYFPISFNSPPGADPRNAVAPEELRDALREILAGSVLFAPWTMALLFEKLGASSADVKMETLETLGVCAESFGPAPLEKYIPNLRAALREAIDDTRLQAAALRTTERVLRALSRGMAPVGGESPAELFILPLIREYSAYLQSPEQRMTPNTGKLLGAAASASDSMCALVCTAALPHVLRAFHAYPSHRKEVGECLVSLLHGTRRSPRPADAAHPIQAHLADLTGVLFALLASPDDVSLVVVAAQCLGLLLAHEGLFDAQQQVTAASIAEQLRGTVVPASASIDVDAAVVDALAHAASPEAQTACVTALVAVAASACSASGAAAAALADIAAAPSAARGVVDAVCGALRASSAMAGAAAAVVIKADASAVPAELCDALFKHAWSNMDAAGAAELAGAAARRAPVDMQRAFVDEAARRCFESSGAQMIALWTLANVRGGALAGVSEWPSVLLARPAADRAAHEAVAVLLNKLPDMSVVDSMVAVVAARPLSDASAVYAAVVATRALLMRAHASGRVLLDALLDTLFSPSDDVTAALVADAFSLLLADAPSLYSRGGFADIKPLYKQRAFVAVRERLLQRSLAAARPAVLRALLALLPHLPPQAVLQELGALLPFILAALSSDDERARAAAVSALRNASRHGTPAAVADHVGSLVTALLAPAADPVLREDMMALLGSVAAMPYVAVHPFRARVLEGIAPFLDDDRRAVRREAVRCRTRWFAAGAAQQK